MSTLKKIFITIIFLSVISLVPISNIKALEIPDKSGLESLISSTTGDCNTVVIYFDGNGDGLYHYLCTSFNAFKGNISSNAINGDRFLDLRKNIYGITSINPYRSSDWTRLNATQSGYYYNGWINDCNQWSCGQTFNVGSNGIIVGFFQRVSVPALFTDIYFTSNTNVNSSIFYKNYNIEYYASVTDYFTNYTGYFTQPTNVKGSSLDFAGDELSASILDFSYGYYNTFMYSFNIDDETTLISHTYNYDNISLSGNFELGFVLTTKRYNDEPLIVHAITDNTYGCTVTPIKTAYNYNYQYYVNCSSVPFTNVSELKIVVNGSNEYFERVGPFLWYDTQYLFNDSDNNKYVGISSILRKSTNVAPTPIQPDEPATNDDIINSIDNLSDNIMDPTSPNVSSLSNSAGWLPAGPVDSIINLPITMLSSLNNVLSTSTCSPVSVPIPFINFNYSLPCLNTIISNMGFATWWEWVGTIASAFILYKYLINLYAWVDKTLTFRENNWNDWGGI